MSKRMPCVGDTRTLTAAPVVSSVDGRRLIEIEAYSGTELEFYGEREILDLSAMKVRNIFPILMEHERNLRVGVADGVEIADSLVVRGYTLGTDAGKEFTATYDDGFPWQASVGARVTGVRRLVEGETEVVNGREFAGPGFILATELREVSVCSLGKDPDTAARALSDTEEEVSMTDKVAPEKEFRAVVRELREAFPDRLDFVLAQAEKGHSVTQAKADLSEVLSLELSEAKTKIAALEAELVKLREGEGGVSFVGELPAGKPEPDTLEAKLDKEWADPDTRAEFMDDKDVFLKYREAELAGLVRIQGVHSKVSR